MSLINLPIGSIIAWENDAIPSGWSVCNGSNGTPDLRDKFIYGASIDGDIRLTGGGGSHTHANPNSSYRTTHNHGGGITLDSSVENENILTRGGTGEKAAPKDHTHEVGTIIGYSDNHYHSVGSTGPATALPLSIYRVFIRRIT